MLKNRQAGITTILIDLANQSSVHAHLDRAVGKAPEGFFAGMPFVADVDQGAFDSVEQLNTLKQAFSDHGLTLIGVTNHRGDTSLLKAAGLADMQLAQTNEKRAPTATPDPKSPHPSREAAQQPVGEIGAKVIRQHVRSGQRIYAKGRDLIVIGTVGAGAEIIADGHISVYGSLRGRAFAGAKGEHSCFIYCSELSAELVSIAGCYQNMEQLDSYKGRKNCLITLDTHELMTVRSLMP